MSGKCIIGKFCQLVNDSVVAPISTRWGCRSPSRYSAWSGRARSRMVDMVGIVLERPCTQPHE
eukprot:1050332-Alexandrium_andersonii.AAC.1